MHDGATARTKDREGRGQGQGRKGGGPGGPGGNRPLRPTGSALTSPPVGAPSVAALAEPASATPRPGAKRPSRAPFTPPIRGHAPGTQSGPAPTEGGSPRHGYPARGHRPRRPSRSSPGRGPGRPDRHDAGPGQRPPGRPHRPSPPPPPLSEEARAGKTPLRTFGQLKQLWETRERPPSRPGSRRRGVGQRGHRSRTTPNANPPQPESITRRLSEVRKPADSATN